MRKKGVRKLFKKSCRDCSEEFRPTGRCCKYCEDCLKRRLSHRRKSVPTKE